MIVFISGTGTDVGKTFVTGCLTVALAQKGYMPGVQKWVSTGNSAVCPDLDFIDKLVSQFVKDGAVSVPTVRPPDDIRCPYKFSIPASPHLAAEHDKKEIDIEVIKSATYEFSQLVELLLIEGAGGLLVPIRRDFLTIDLVAQLKIPVIIVADAGLGTLNHTLLSIEACRARGIEILSVVLNHARQFNPQEDQDSCEKLIVQDNVSTIASIGKVDVWGPIPHSDTYDPAVSILSGLADKIINSFAK